MAAARTASALLLLGHLLLSDAFTTPRPTLATPRLRGLGVSSRRAPHALRRCNFAMMASGGNKDLVKEAKRDGGDAQLDVEIKKELEDELKDSQGWLGYIAPRPVRQFLVAALGANSLWGGLVLLSRYAANGQQAELQNAAGNLAFALFCAGVFAFENKSKEDKKQRRALLKQKQIQRGDREVFTRVDEEGNARKFSRLKPVDADWIVRKVDQWGVQETRASGGNPLPTVGPVKGQILEDLVSKEKPMFIVDIGSFVGYSAIRMARRQPKGGLTVTIEKGLRWHLTSKRFVWQAMLWQQYPWEPEPEQKVECLFGDALERLRDVAQEYGPADMIFIDGAIAEYPQYIRACEEGGLVQEGTIIVADNVGVFSAFDGVKDYVKHIEGGGYESERIPCTLEYRDDTPDEMMLSRRVSPVKTGGVKA